MIRRQLPAFSPVPATAILQGLWSSAGGKRDRTAEFEAALRGKFDARQALLFNSGTSALRKAVEISIMEVDRNMRVALPAYGCYDLATAVIGAGATAFLYDLDAFTLGPDLQSLRTVLEAGARTVVVAHLYGFPVDVLSVRELCDEFDAFLIEDSAQGVGGLLNNKALGSFGDLSVLSFGRGKGWSGGGGGALLIRAGCRVPGFSAGERGAVGWQNLAGLLAAKLMGRPGIYGIPASMSFLKLGETVYHKPSPPKRISRASAAVVGGTWEPALREAAERRENVSRMLERIAGVEVLVPSIVDGAEPGYLRLPVKRPVGVRLEGETYSLGVIEAYPTPLSRLSALNGTVANPDIPLPGAERLAERLVTFPTHSRLYDRDIAGLRKVLERWAGIGLETR